MNFNTYIILFLFLGLCSCTTYHPIQQQISETDYNSRRKVFYPELERKLNPIGYGLLATGAAAGGYFAYDKQPIRFNGDANNSNRLNVANGAVGAIAGFGIVAITNYLISQQGKRKPLSSQKDRDNWVKRYNKHYKLLRQEGAMLHIIDSRVENNFQGKTVADVHDFSLAFRGSTNTANVFQQATKTLDRSELPALVDIYPTSAFNKEAKIRFFDESQEMSDFVQAYKLYPKVPYDRETKAISLVKSYHNASWVLYNFPMTERKAEILSNSMATAYDSDAALKMKSKLGDSFYLKAEAIKKQPKHYAYNYMNSLLYVERPSRLQDLRNLFYNYKWLDFPEQKKLYLHQAWNIADRNYKNGDEMLEVMSNLQKTQDISFLNIRKSYSNIIIRQFLEKAIREELSIEAEQIKSPSSGGGFDSWKSSYVYDSPYLYEEGDRTYLYTGKLVNNSKFTFPVKMTTVGNLVRITTSELWNMEVSKKKSISASRQVDYYIPKLRTGESFPFAILCEFGSGKTAEGFNVAGAQVYAEYDMEPGEPEFKLLNEVVTSNQLEKQKYWLSLKDKTLSKTKAKELFGYDYDPNNYIFELPTKEDYQDMYGEDCGCNAIGIEPERSWGKVIYYDLILENGMEDQFSYRSDGKLELHDGILGFGRSTFSSYSDMIKHVTENCTWMYCK